MSWATSLLFTGVPAWCVLWRVRCPGPLRSCSPVCPLGALLCLCGVLGHLAPVHGVPARCVVFGVRCPGPLGSCSPVCPLRALRCLCGVLGHLAPVDRWAHWVCCVARLVSWANWLLFTGVPAPCVALRVRCPGQPRSCSPMCPPGVLCCGCRVLGHLAPAHWCARAVCCVACAVSGATWLLLTGVPARCIAFLVRCPGPLLVLLTGVPARCVVLVVRCWGPLVSYSPVCPLGALCCVCGVWATWLLFTGVPARCVLLGVQCPGPLGYCSPVCSLGALC